MMFEDFWRCYPATARRVNKKGCREIWQREKLDAVAGEILAHLEAMKGTKQWKTGYEPMPATYLRQCRWEDGMPQEEQMTEARLYLLESMR